jgi:uncharacterized membrane protein YtjA (UPF0391 family)
LAVSVGALDPRDPLGTDLRCRPRGDSAVPALVRGVHFKAQQGAAMFAWSLIFLIFALVAAVLGFGGIAASAASIAKIVFVVAVVLMVASAVVGLIRRG